MNVLPADLSSAALGARDRLGDLARRAASAALQPNEGAGSAAAMGAAARGALFADAPRGGKRSAPRPTSPRATSPPPKPPPKAARSSASYRASRSLRHPAPTTVI